MDRVDWYFEQQVTEEELNGAFDDVENAMFRLMTDQGLFGIFAGIVGAQVTPVANLSITESGPGYAYDQAGERITVASPLETVDCSIDQNSVSTAVAGVGNEKWLSVFLKFTRVLSDPRTDGNSMLVYFEHRESKEYVIVQGAEAPVGTAARPTKDPTMLLAQDINLQHGDTQILNAAIFIDRRDDTIVINQSPLSIRAGTPLEAVTAMLMELNEHINGSAGEHPSTAITDAGYPGGTNFTIASGTVRSVLGGLASALDSYISALAAQTGAGGTSLVGGAATGHLTAGTVANQLGQLDARTYGFMRIVGIYTTTWGPTAFDQTALVTDGAITIPSLQVGDILVSRANLRYSIAAVAGDGNPAMFLIATGSTATIDAIDSHTGAVEDVQVRNLIGATAFSKNTVSSIAGGAAVTMSLKSITLSIGGSGTGNGTCAGSLEIIVYRP